jgi:hypothetical protein
MNKLFTLTLLLVLIVTNASAQETFWERYSFPHNLKFDFKKTILCSDSDWISIGNFGGRCLISKGNDSIIEFARFYRSPTSVFGINDMIQLPDKGFICCGTSGPISAQDISGFIMRIDSVGNLIWTKALNVATDGFFLRLASADYNTFIATGYENGHLAYLKFDGNGNIISYKRHSYAYAGLDILMSENGCLLLGKSYDPFYLDVEIYILKVDSTDNIQWAKKYGWFSDEEPFSLIQSLDNGYLVSANVTEVGLPYFYSMVMNLDTSGLISWCKLYQNATGVRYPKPIIISDSTYLVGFTSNINYGNPGLQKLDVNGNEQWLRRYSDMDNAPNREDLVGFYEKADHHLMLFAKDDSSFQRSSLSMIQVTSDGYSSCFDNTDSSFTIDTIPPVTAQSHSFINVSYNIQDTVIMVSDTAWTKDTTCYCEFYPYPSVDGFIYTDSGLTVSFIDTSVEATNWRWYFGDGDSANIQNPIHHYQSSGTYQVCLFSSSICGIDSICQFVTVTGLGVESEITDNSIVVFPNPANTSINIKFPSRSNYEIKLLDVTGRIILHTISHSDIQSFVLPEECKAGIYAVNVYDAAHQLLFRKRIVVL